VAVVAPALVAACGEKAKPLPGKSCTLNSECNDPLSCTFGRCHATCAETRDCPLGQRCVKVASGNVCQLPEEKMCPPTRTCTEPLICAGDLQCRGRCATAADCPRGQVCAAGGACAEPGEVTPEGRLAGVGGSAADAGAGPADAAAGPPALDAAGGATADRPADTAGTGPCGVPEREPNDSRDQATPLAPTQELPSCLGTAADKDWYEITAPSDPGGGYVEIAITDVGELTPELVGFTASDNGRIDHLYGDSAGQTLYAFLAVAPGQKYRLVFGAFAEVARAPARYTIKTTYRKVDDAHEPNDSAATAKPIMLGTPVTAYLHAGPKMAKLAPEDVSDWYSVTLAAGPVSLKMSNVPMNVTAFVGVIDSTGKKVYTGTSANNGANIDAMMEVSTGGTHVIHVTSFALAPVAYARAPRAGAVPDSYTRAYTLLVSRP
jgi:hypothetical protein